MGAKRRQPTNRPKNQTPMMRLTEIRRNVPADPGRLRPTPPERGQLVLDLDEFSLQRPICGCVFIPLWTSGPGSTLCNASAGPKTFGLGNARPPLPLNGRQALHA